MNAKRGRPVYGLEPVAWLDADPFRLPLAVTSDQHLQFRGGSMQQNGRHQIFVKPQMLIRLTGTADLQDLVSRTKAQFPGGSPATVPPRIQGM